MESYLTYIYFALQSFWPPNIFYWYCN